LIVEGERADLLERSAKGTTAAIEPTVPSSGVRAAEIVQLVDARPAAIHGAGDTVHTHAEIGPPLAYTYKRDTVAIYANVVAATHGETRHEVLGSGDAGRPYQSFA